MSEQIKQRILEIKATGTNMFNMPAIQGKAFSRGWYDVVLFIEAEPELYVHFIVSSAA